MKIAIVATDNRQERKNYQSEMPSFHPAIEALLQGFAVLPGLEVHVVSCLQRPVKSPEKLSANIWFHALHVPKIGWLRTFYQGCIRATRKKLTEIDPDIVHGQGTERDCGLCAVFSGFPNVITVHGNMLALSQVYKMRSLTFRSLFHWLSARLETPALKKTAGVFCNSAYTETQVAPRAKKTWRVPNAVRAAFFNSAQACPKNARPVLLNVGVLSAHKRQLEILNMAEKLWKRGLRFELRFAGTLDSTSDYVANFRHELARAESLGYARHIGILKTEELIAAMDAADALIHFPTEESFGLVVAEALARNLKLFTASVGGIVDIASNVEGTLLAPINDFLGLENAIAQWMENGWPRPADAAEVMRQRYFPEIVARRHLEIYRKVLEKIKMSSQSENPAG